MRSPICRNDALLGLELDDVLLGDATLVLPEDRPYRESYSVFDRNPRTPRDAGWGAWRERELEAYRKRCEHRAKQWNATMAGKRAKQERESRERWKRDEERRRIDLLRQEVPLLSVYVSNSIPEAWAMWTVLWVDIGWCMKTLGERGIATNQRELVKSGVTTIHPTSRGYRCGLCLAAADYLVIVVQALGIVRCIPCWMRHRMLLW